MKQFMLLHYGAVRLVLCSMLSMVVFSGCSEVVESTYSSGADAISDGAVSRGWLPSFLPKEANDIIEIHDLDTNKVIGTFTVSRINADNIIQQSTQIAFGETLISIDGNLLPKNDELLDVYKFMTQIDAQAYKADDALHFTLWYFFIHASGNEVTFLYWN